ncbi:hypothetical protein N7488_003959 [Penicillium malachiteum]|nr:hypothetical protein N7488_003959 [Penicillium malachiteum]
MTEEFEGGGASRERTRQRDLEKEKHWNVFNALDENFFATESDPTELEESSSDDGFGQTLAERPALKKTRGCPGELDNFYDSDYNRKVTYHHDDARPNPFHGQDIVPSEPLNQIPEEPGSSSLPSPSKESSRKEYNKGKNPIREGPFSSAQSGQTDEEARASSSIQDSRNPYPDLPPLTASVEDWLSRSRPTDNVVSDRSPDQLNEDRIPGQRDLIPLAPAGPLAFSQIEDRPHSPGQPSMLPAKKSKKKVKQLTGTGERLG